MRLTEALLARVSGQVQEAAGCIGNVELFGRQLRGLVSLWTFGDLRIQQGEIKVGFVGTGATETAGGFEAVTRLIEALKVKFPNLRIWVD